MDVTSKVKKGIETFRDKTDPGLSLRIMEARGETAPPPAPAAPVKRVARPFQAEDPDLSVKSSNVPPVDKAVGTLGQIGKKGAGKPRAVGTAGRMTRGRR